MIKKLIIVLAFTFFVTGCLPRLKSDDGVASQSEFIKGKAISSFPNMPRYPKSQLLESINDNNSYGASIISEENIQKVVDFYSNFLPQTGWESTFVKKTETHYVFEVKNTDYSGEVIVNTASDNKSTAISVFVEPR